LAHEGDRYQLMLAADLQEAAQKRLQMFVLRAKVKLVAQTDGTAAARPGRPAS
jgi:folate-binding Fe-S cluster repair protein YgfZ